MTLAEAYIEVAERAILAAEGALRKAVQEKAGFLAYHAFESSGGAFCVSRGVPYPKRHAKKLNVFSQAVRRERFARQVAQLAIELLSMRELLLYPRPLQNGRIECPKGVITAGQAQRLLGRVNTLVGRIRTVV